MGMEPDERERKGRGKWREEREETAMEKSEKGEEEGKVGQVLSGYFPYPKWLNLIPNSGSRTRHKSRHKHPRCYFLFRASRNPDARPNSPSSSASRDTREFSQLSASTVLAVPIRRLCNNDFSEDKLLIPTSMPNFFMNSKPIAFFSESL